MNKDSKKMKIEPCQSIDGCNYVKLHGKNTVVYSFTDYFNVMSDNIMGKLVLMTALLNSLPPSRILLYNKMSIFGGKKRQ